MIERKIYQRQKKKELESLPSPEIKKKSIRLRLLTLFTVIVFILFVIIASIIYFMPNIVQWTILMPFSLTLILVGSFSIILLIFYIIKFE
jgi:polyferredoxin